VGGSDVDYTPKTQEQADVGASRLAILFKLTN
jgi:hypothetical protein